MLITNTTSYKLRLSEFKSKSEDEVYEAFAYIISPGCSLDIEADSLSISIEVKEDDR